MGIQIETLSLRFHLPIGFCVQDISSIFSFRYHRIGLVVLYLHDVADVFLESSKIVLCFKKKSPSKLLEFLSGAGFLGFSFAW